ncbi:hypothetical protein C8J57DRAFT_983406, partial [Mycena rebaudengoi]
LLADPTSDGKWRVEIRTHASATNACLFQLQNAAWVPIAYITQSLSVGERTYSVLDREMLGMVCAFRAWKSYM